MLTRLKNNRFLLTDNTDKFDAKILGFVHLDPPSRLGSGQCKSSVPRLFGRL